jgi:hypothetical protein
MLTQINTDNRVHADEALQATVRALVADTLGRFTSRISRIEVHLGDESGNRQTENDKRCMIEARIEGRKPLAVTHLAATIPEAVEGAAQKLLRAVESALGKNDAHRRAP